MAKSFKTLSDPIMADPARAVRVAEHEAAIRDSLGLGEMRAHRGATQVQMAHSIGVTQARVSSLERQDDLYLSTLESYIKALGGTLEVHAVFPDETVALIPADRATQAD